MRPLNYRFRLGFHSLKGWARPSLRGLALSALAAGWITACGSSTTPNTGGFDQNSTTTSVVTYTSTGTSTLADGGVVTTTTTGTSTVTSTVTNTSHSTTSTSGSNPSTSSTTNTSGSSTSGSSTSASGADAGDGGFVCANTDMTKINIDATGFACNNQWGIVGAWYCYADGVGTSDCTGSNGMGQGAIPYRSSANAMCIKGTTSNSTNGGTAFGAGIGLVLNGPVHGSTAKNVFNAPGKNIVGFAITVSGNTGGSVLNVNYPQMPALTSTGENAAVTVPAVNGTAVTFNTLLGNAVITDNTTVVPKLNPAEITDVQVALPGADGVAHTYDFCITSVVPLTAAPAAPSSLGAYGTSFNEGKQIVLEGLGAYGVQNDPFGVGTDPMSMTASYGGGMVGFTASPTFGDTGNTPGAFPSIVSGWVHGGAYISGASGGYAGGKTISGTNALQSVKSNWAYSAGSGKWDAAYDVWFAANADPLNAGSELMVWLGHNGVNPIGGQNTAVTVTGATTGSWTVSTGTNGTGQPVVSYVATSNLTSVTGFDLLPFFKEAANSGRAGLSSGSNLLSVQAGFELYQAGTWTTSSYSVAIQ
jgi:Glycosyl hydrolase family 12